MSKSASKIIVNCGTTHISVSVFSEKDGQLVLEKLLLEDLIYNYNAEEEWANIAPATLRGMLANLKIKGEAIIIAPGYLLLTKNVKVPQVEKSRQQQIISFEAQNSFPFPLNELVWDSQIISSDGVEAEVVLFALKNESANQFAYSMQNAGATPVAVKPSTNLDYQAYRFLEPNAQENVLIVNVGARTTNLTFVTPEGFGVQNIAVGGNLLTQFISDALGKPFQASEHLKINYFSGAMQVAEDDPHAMSLNTCSQNFCRRLGQEITRRIVNFKRQNKTGAPTKILLTGRGALLPGLSESLAESQRLSVEYFEPTTLLTCSSEVSPDYVDAYRFRLSEVVGEAAGLITGDVDNVNLLPRKVLEEILFAKKRSTILFSAFLLAIAPWPIFSLFYQENNQLERIAGEYTSQISLLKNRDSDLSNFEKRNGAAAIYIDKINEIGNKREYWHNFLASLNEAIARLQMPIVSMDDDEVSYKSGRHVWIDNLRVDRSIVTPVLKTDGEVSDEQKVETGVIREEVVITFRMLIPEIDGSAPEHDAAIFDARRKELESAILKCPYIKNVVRDKEVADWKEANRPKLTFVFVLKPEGEL